MQHFWIFSSSYAMRWLYVCILFYKCIPAKFVLLNNTYGNMEFISSGEPASFTSAQAWCKQHRSTLAEITDDNIWDLTLMFVNKFNLGTHNLILNVEGRELPDWQWITRKTFRNNGSYYSLINGTRTYHNAHAHLSKLSWNGVEISSNCMDGKCKHGYVCEHHICEHDINSIRNNQGIPQSVPIDGICYIFHHDEFVTWFEALHACEKNNGRLATFRNAKTDVRKIAAHLEYGRRYWIGLQRWEWRWAASGQLITYARWAMPNPYQNHSCAYVNLRSHAWYSACQCTDEVFKFFCIRDVTKCASNPCHNGAACVASIHNYTCRCVMGFTGLHCERKLEIECGNNLCKNGATCRVMVNKITCICLPGFTGPQCQTKLKECDSNPCQNGGTCSGSIHDHTCLCPLGFTGSKCQSAPNQTNEPNAFPNMQILIISAIIIISVIIIITIFVLICHRKCKARLSNDEGGSRNYETLIKPASHYEVLRIRDGGEYFETIGSQSPSQGNAIPHHHYQNVHAGDTSTSCPVVYVNLESVHQYMSVQI